MNSEAPNRHARRAEAARDRQRARQGETAEEREIRKARELLEALEAKAARARARQIVNMPPTPIERAETIDEFCQIERMSRSGFYLMMGRGEGPEITINGRRRTITPEAHRAWRRKRAVKIRRPAAIAPLVVEQS